MSHCHSAAAFILEIVATFKLISLCPRVCVFVFICLPICACSSRGCGYNKRLNAFPRGIYVFSCKHMALNDVQRGKTAHPRPRLSCCVWDISEWAWNGPYAAHESSCCGVKRKPNTHLIHAHKQKHTPFLCSVVVEFTHLFSPTQQFSVITGWTLLHLRQHYIGERDKA